MPNPIYGSGNPPSNGNVNQLPGVIANRGSSSYFNKSGLSSGLPPSNGALPSLGSGGIALNNPKPNPLGSYGGFNKPTIGSKPLGGMGMGSGSYKYGGISGGIGGAMSNSGLGHRNTDAQNPYYQENSQGAQGSIGSSGSGM